MPKPKTTKTPPRQPELSALEEKLWKTAKRFDQQDHFCCVIITMRRLLDNLPDHGPGWLCYAIALRSLARYKEALVALRRAEQLAPQTMLRLVYSQYGHLYEGKGNFRLAEKWFRRTMESFPEHTDGYIYLGALFAVEGRLAEAEAIHRQATQCKVGCIDEAYLNLGMVIRAQDRFEEALDCFQRALEIDPKDKNVKREIADVTRAIKLLAKS